MSAGKRIAEFWSHVPRPSWPLRRDRRAVNHGVNEVNPPAETIEVGRTLGAFRIAALWAIGAFVATADGAAFAESYRGLWLWATHHWLTGFWAAIFPLQVDVFIVIGELVLFVAMVDRWRKRDRAGAWAVALLGLAVSIAGNVGHVAGHDLQSRGTAAVPPVAAFGALWLGLGVLKRVIRQRSEATTAADETSLPEAAGGQLAALLADLTDAVRSLAERTDNPVSSPVASADGTSLLAEMLEAVRGLGGQIGDAVSSPVPADAEHAALIAYQATVRAGNPLSANALQSRFGLTRAQVARITKIPEHEPGAVPRLAAANGHQAAGANP